MRSRRSQLKRVRPTLKHREAREENPAFQSRMIESLLTLSVDDLEELFREPWRDGRNAVRLCCEAAAIGGHQSEDGDRALLWVGEILKRTDPKSFTTADYDRGTELQYELSRSARLNDVFYTHALGILTNWIAHSDGGGHVPNDWLRRAFWTRLRDGDGVEVSTAVELIGKWRAGDLGVKWAGTTERETMYRWLWLGGRYRLAIDLAKRV